MQQKFLNLHSGQLPKYRGLYALWWAMTAGDIYAACVLHEIDHGIDTGCVFKVRKFVVDMIDMKRLQQLEFINLKYL